MPVAAKGLGRVIGFQEMVQTGPRKRAGILDIQMNIGKMIKEVKYQIGQYKGTVSVSCDEDDDNDEIIAKAKARLKRYDTLGMAYRSYKVLG